MDTKKIQKSQITTNELLGLSQDAVMSKINCHNIGKIIEFNSETQRAVVQMQQTRRYFDRYIQPVILTDVPIVIYGSINAHITMPNIVGSTCVLLFMDRNIDTFLETGEMYVPNTNRMHNMTDCIALVTFKTAVDHITNYDVNAINIEYSKRAEDTSYDANLKNYANKVELKSHSLKETEEETEEKESSITINPSQIHLKGGKIKLSNDTRNMATLIDNLITTIKAITITNGVVSTASQNALANIATQFGELLE